MALESLTTHARSTPETQSMAESVFGFPIGQDTEIQDTIPMHYEPSQADVAVAEAYVASHGTEDLSPVMYRMLRSLPVDYGKDEFNGLSMYIHEIMEFPLLDAQSERSLFQQVQKGLNGRKKLSRYPEKRTQYEDAIQRGLEAEQHLIMANTRWVFSIAKRFSGGPLELLDLVQEGNVGLHRGLKKFDLKRGTRFSTYATCWIRHTIQTALEKEHPMHLSREQVLLLRKIRKEQEESAQTLGRYATKAEIALKLDIDESVVGYLLHISHHPLSMEHPRSMQSTDDMEGTIGDTVTDTHVIFQAPTRPEVEANQHMLRDELLEAVANLPERERNILFYRYGLIDGETHSLEETGVFFGVKKQRIHQLEKQAISRIPEKSLQKLGEYLGRNR